MSENDNKIIKDEIVRVLDVISRYIKNPSSVKIDELLFRLKIEDFPINMENACVIGMVWKYKEFIEDDLENLTTDFQRVRMMKDHQTTLGQAKTYLEDGTGLEPSWLAKMLFSSSRSTSVSA